MSEITYWVYMLQCSNGSYYTGYTTDMARRYQEHVKGTAKCKYTRSFKPLNIARCWAILDCRSTVMKIEKFIKKLPKKEKEALILKPNRLLQLYRSHQLQES